MTEANESSANDGLAFLKELIDQYGLEGLTTRLAAAIEEAEAGRVAGPALDEATTWIEQEHGSGIASFAGEGRLTLSAGPVAGAMFGGSGRLDLSGGVSTGTSAEMLIQDVVLTTDKVAISLTETAHVAATDLPTNMQVIAQVHDVFWYLVGAWGLMDLPIEAVPFVMLMTLAIVVVRIRLKQP